ncbi:MAG: SDR family NAD(P)-dependent oxidoreductase [Deltaproteobacteria bacterium]
MSEGRLAGKRALITGAASGIGRATAERFAAEGARVAILDHDAAAAAEVATAVGGISHAVDLADAEAADGAVRAVCAELGGLDILVGNAGIGMVKRLHEYSIQEWDRLVAVNLNAAFYVLRPALPLLLEGEGGVVIHNASGSAVRPTRGEGPYAAAKAGLVALTSNIAQEYGPKIRANCVSPGIIRTPMSESLFRIPGLLEPFVEANPLGRSGTAAEVADVFVFLASNESSYLNGQNIVLDGGGSLAQPGIDNILRFSVPPLEPKK